MTERTATGAGGTDAAILDVAERLVQKRGFNGFSYADIADELSITKASLHYHFPSKADLGEALLDRYSERFSASLAAIRDGGAPVGDMLRAYAGLYASVLAEQRMCLCGMLAAEYETLPDPMQEAIVRFFDLNEVWLQDVLTRGRREGTLAFQGTPREVARAIVAGLEGAMLVARAQGRADGFGSSAERLVQGLAGASAPRRRGGAAG
jgi:TetR/AcrR family transcriptional repressor of nem operon